VKILTELVKYKVKVRSKVTRRIDRALPYSYDVAPSYRNNLPSLEADSCK